MDIRNLIKKNKDLRLRAEEDFKNRQNDKSIKNLLMIVSSAQDINEYKTGWCRPIKIKEIGKLKII